MSGRQPLDDDTFDAAIREDLEARARHALDRARPVEQLLGGAARRRRGVRPGLAAAAAVALLLVVALVLGAAGVWLGTTPTASPSPSSRAVALPPTTINWPALRRPLHLPSLAAGASCPVTPGQTIVPGLPAMAGDGPLHPLTSAGSGGTVYYDSPSAAGPQGVVVTWVAAPGVTGPALVRGRRLDGAGALAFGRDEYAELQLTPYGTASPVGSAGYVALESDLTVIPAPGCYAYQIDTATSTSVVVFAAQPASALAKVLRQRPLRLPTLAPGATCPTGSPRPVASWVGPAIGAGPVYSIGYGPGPAAILRFGGTTESGGWYLEKILWLAAPRASGPILVRGHQLDGSNAVRFGDGATPASDLLLSDVSQVGVSGSGFGWRNFVAYTRIRAAGCYAYQVDTVAGSEVIVFAAAP